MHFLKKWCSRFIQWPSGVLQTNNDFYEISVILDEQGFKNWYGSKTGPTGLIENCENQSKIGLNLNFKFDFDEHR
jgi:hypothetical protein